MTERTITINDNLEELKEYCKQEIINRFCDYIEENPEMDEWDTYYQAQGCDAAHEIADSNTPVYHSNIDGLYYLYGEEFDMAYNNAGFGDKTEDNYKQAAIYCCLSNATRGALDTMRGIFETWQEKENHDIAELKALVKQDGEK